MNFQKINLNTIAAVFLGIVVIAIINKILQDKKEQIYYIPPPPKKRKDFSKSTKEQVLARQGYGCNSCGQYSSLFDFHHKNGDKSNNYSSNCEALCPLCHAKKTRKKS